MVIEARTFGRLSRKIVTAGAYRIEPLDDLEGLAHHSYRSVRSEVSGSIVVKLASHEDPRKRFLRRDLDVGVPLVITELNVEAWLILLDQVGFEDQGFGLRPHDDRLQ